MKKGFTLAEVLITLGIIGVIAAITLPTMMQDGKKQQLGVKLSKFHNSLESVTRPYYIENPEGFGEVFDGTYTDYAIDLAKHFISNTAITDAVGIIDLRDGTSVRLGNPGTLNTDADSKFGAAVPTGGVEFFPNINGLDGQNSFTFTITNKGFVLPSGNDACLTELYNHKWRATKYYKTKTGEKCAKKTS